MRRSASRVGTILAVTGAVVLTGCSSGPGSRDEPPGEPVVTVYAAASLTDSFETIAEDFERAQRGTPLEGVEVELSLAGSSDLLAQLEGGARADVLATADEITMTRAVDAALVSDGYELFATNTLQIATPPDNPAGIESLADLADPGARVVVCAPQVPCGAASERVERASGVDLDPVSEEQSVADVLGKVRSGEADAGLVYVTDVRAAGDSVLGIDLPEAANVVNAYPIAVLDDAPAADLARAFVEYVLSAQAQGVLAEAGFGTP